jgi:copper chaperone CopZ
VSEILLNVPDMSCDHCVRAISSEVAVVPGVETVDVQLAAKTVRVTGTASEDAIRAAVVEAGYEAA